MFLQPKQRKLLQNCKVSEKSTTHLVVYYSFKTSLFSKCLPIKPLPICLLHFTLVSPLPHPSARQFHFHTVTALPPPPSSMWHAPFQPVCLPAAHTRLVGMNRSVKVSCIIECAKALLKMGGVGGGGGMMLRQLDRGCRGAYRWMSIKAFNVSERSPVQDSRLFWDFEREAQVESLYWVIFPTSPLGTFFSKQLLYVYLWQKS